MASYLWTDEDLARTQTVGSRTVITGNSSYETPRGTRFESQFSKGKSGLSVKLFFKYIKQKFGLLGGKSFENRIKKLWELAEQSEKNGQVALSEQFIERIAKETRESEMYALGYKIFLEKEWVEKFRGKTTKNILETKLKNYARVIPESNQKDIKKALDAKVFDEIIIMHTDVKAKELTIEEKRDPIAFGKIQESERYYFITDWEDEYCDLTLDDIIDELDLKESDMKIKKNPSLEG